LVTVGQRIAGRYRLLRPLAAGGMGGVWLAHDEADDDLVALKKCAIPDGLTPDEQDLFRVWTVREARAFAVVGHPNVVRTLDVLPGEDTPWIVMEYVASRSLQQVIDESGPLPPARVAGVGLAVLEALLAVRRVGLLHLDVKPGNVLIADDGRVVLTDFGPAVTTEGVRALARAGIILGSPKYLAPERLFDGVALPESDLWSLGATLYHAVEGHPPFVRDSTAATLLAITEGPPEPPTRAGALEPVIAGLLRIDPADRLAPPAVEDGLRAVIRQPVERPALPAPKATVPKPTAPPPTPPSPRATRAAPRRPRRPGRSRRRVAALAGALAVLVALITVFAVTRPGGESAAKPRVQVDVSDLPPPGFAWHTAPRLYRIALPQKWKVARGVDSATGPQGRPLLTVRAEPAPANAVAALTAQEAKVGLPGYRRIRIEQMSPNEAVFAGEAVWEFTYLQSSGAMRAMQLVIPEPSGDRVFILDWRAPRDQWARDLTILDQIVVTFRPLSDE
jgi:hypothetical protein